MRLHRPSAAVGVGVGLTAVLLVVISVVSASALTWPWSPSDKTAAVETVTGSVSCSSITDINTGYGGNPASLTVDAGAGAVTVSWPFKLQSGRFGSVFLPPSFTAYRWLVTVPAGQQQATVHWSLTCRDQTGAVDPQPTTGSFAVSRAALSRTICSARAGFSACTGPQLQADLSTCAYALLSPYTGSPEVMTALDIASIKTASQWVGFFAGKADPALGLAIACSKAVKTVIAGPAPTKPSPVTVPPPSTAPPPAHPSTTAPPPAPRTTSSAAVPPPAKADPSRPAPGKPTAPPPPTSAAPPPPPTTSNPPAPAPSTFAETTGGPTHTWTNYTNAGGSPGAVIPTNATVQIACKIQGFRVADGNTWWYRIASAPWSGTFYASADAFYNNGLTSGSLHGTPYVDPAVPTC